MGQPLVIRRRLGPMSDMRDQRLRSEVELEPSTHHTPSHSAPFTHHRGNQTNIPQVRYAQPPSQNSHLPPPHTLPTSQQPTTAVATSSVIIQTSQPRAKVPSSRGQWVWLHTGKGMATQDLLSWWRDTISDSVYVCFIHSHSLPFDYVHNITSPTVLHYVYILQTTIATTVTGLDGKGKSTKYVCTGYYNSCMSVL